VASVVVDLGFGDAGKGLLTDYLVRSTEADCVVRFNGGAQAGHNVIDSNGRHHTFSQFGSGSFVAGVRTHLARPVVVHPTALRVEAERLARIGVTDAFARLTVDPECLVTTPFQQAAGRLRELQRAEARHGSCGVGVGETVQDALESPELSLRFADLSHPARARDRLLSLRARKAREFEALSQQQLSPALEREYSALLDPQLPDRWLSAAAQIARCVRMVRDEDLKTRSDSLVFEGAQGVLLDERFGFHPHTTFSRCGFDGALDLLANLGFSGDVRRIGVLRSYMVRHGPGPLPTEDERVSAQTVELHNEMGPWQKHVRKGWPDFVLLDYALRASGGVDEVALTHLDALRAFPQYPCCLAYEGAPLALPNGIAEQETLTRRLFAASPEYHTIPASRFCDLLEAECRVKVGWVSTGPRASDVSRRA
ncbi:MAG TPA: adenylosuccinate synthetase, partial [Polyangiaceae bacterium]|nr:adenylosuccinate synthetase [Polyangiaceae bacterium]